MLKGFWKLTWVETKIFVREPMGVIGTVGIPVVLFLVLGRVLGQRGAAPANPGAPPFNVAILAALFISIGAVLSLITIISIYREGGILKRLRATPLSPVTILSAQVFLKMVFTALTLGLLVLAGRRFLPGSIDVPVASFTVALLLSTLSILSMGFIIASIIPTARFAQPIGAALLYPMVAISGLFFPVEGLPPVLRAVAEALPTTRAVSLMQGIWSGAGWGAHLGDVAALILAFGVFTALSTRLFRWE